MLNHTAQDGTVGNATPRTVANNGAGLKDNCVGDATQSGSLGLDQNASLFTNQVNRAIEHGKLPMWATKRLVLAAERSMAIAAGTAVIQRLLVNVGIEAESDEGATSLDSASVGQLQMMIIEANNMLSSSIESIATELNREFQAGAHHG